MKYKVIPTGLVYYAIRRKNFIRWYFLQPEGTWGNRGFKAFFNTENEALEYIGKIEKRTIRIIDMKEFDDNPNSVIIIKK